MVYDIKKVKDGTVHSKTYLSQPLIHMSQRQVWQVHVTITKRYTTLRKREKGSDRY